MQGHRPVIGIPQCLDDRGRWKSGRDYLYVDLAYARAVEAAGGIPLHLPLQGDPNPLLERIDALLIPGGDDLPPASPYPSDVEFDLTPGSQIQFDTQLLAGALTRRLPVLGICYGMQLLALHHGGTLHYHLPSDLPAAGAHQLHEADGRHAIALEPGTHVAAAAGDHPPPVNSLHHQAVATAGSGLRVSGRAPDGVIEAIEAISGVFTVGVQWHPEKLSDSSSSGLFRAFVTAATP